MKFLKFFTRAWYGILFEMCSLFNSYQQVTIRCLNRYLDNGKCKDCTNANTLHVNKKYCIHNAFSVTFYESMIWKTVEYQVSCGKKKICVNNQLVKPVLKIWFEEMRKCLRYCEMHISDGSFYTSNFCFKTIFLQ